MLNAESKDGSITVWFEKNSKSQAPNYKEITINKSQIPK
jgi:hypothetical protein